MIYFFLDKIVPYTKVQKSMIQQACAYFCHTFFNEEDVWNLFDLIQKDNKIVF